MKTNWKKGDRFRSRKGDTLGYTGTVVRRMRGCPASDDQPYLIGQLDQKPPHWEGSVGTLPNCGRFLAKEIEPLT